VLVELTSAGDVRAVVPDRDAILELGGYALVTAAGDQPGVDSVCRFFAPAAGIDEDPVTGSAHCVLAPFWAGRLGRTELVGEQVSARGGTVGMRVAGDQVVLTGQAVTVLVAQLQVDPSPA
jgi:predicted PhzF superfamily epimerase YddE/YHI9